ncbi:unnamed protein product [Diamesa tonsa]
MEQGTITYFPNKVGKIFQNLLNLKVGPAELAYICKENFEDLTSLQSLVLFGNEIAKIPADTFVHLVDLEVLDLGFNFIETIEQGLFSKNKRLKKISLKMNKITIIYPGEFSPLKELTQLNLSKNKCNSKNFEKKSDFNDLETTLRKCEPKDESGSNSMTEMNCFYGETIHNEYSCNVESLSIDEDDIIDNVRVDHVNDHKNKDVKLLKITKTRTDHIRSNLLNNFQQLDTLIISNCDWRGIPNLYGTKSITKLFINDNEKLEEITEAAFEGLTRIRTISLRKNKIKDIHLLAFSYLSKLHYMDLSHNQIETLTNDIFSESVHLTKLSLANNKIASLTMSIFEMHKHLQLLSFQNNRDIRITKEDKSRENYHYLDFTGNSCLNIFFDRKSNRKSNKNSYEILMKCYGKADPPL